MSNFTPGPWFIRGGMTPPYTLITSNSGDVIDNFGNPKKGAFFDSPPIPLEEHRANVRLIANAPELYDLVFNGQCNFQQEAIPCGNCERCQKREKVIAEINEGIYRNL